MAFLLEFLFPGTEKRDDWTNGAKHVRCGFCGRYVEGPTTAKSRCGACDEIVVVCDEHNGPIDKCVKCCKHTDDCEVCGDTLRTAYLNAVVCGSCEAELVVCDEDVAAPLCKDCRG